MKKVLLFLLATFLCSSAIILANDTATLSEQEMSILYGGCDQQYGNGECNPEATWVCNGVYYHQCAFDNSSPRRCGMLLRHVPCAGWQYVYIANYSNESCSAYE